MSLVISRVFTYDTDAGNYIQAVEGPAGDNQVLEPAVRQAINNFVIGCKQDGIWTAIKASCILAGARTLAGALVPLVGAAPTNNGFIGIGTDYDRKTGLVGNGSTKYLDSNRAGNADPQNSKHVSVYTTVTGQNYLGDLSNITTLNQAATAIGARVNSTDGTGGSAGSYALGFQAGSRISASEVIWRGNSASQTATVTSQSGGAGNLMVFRTQFGYSSGRLAFYSIGESLDLALLDARVTALITAFGAAIP